MAAHLQLQTLEWLEGEPAGAHATPTPRDTLRPAPEPASPADLITARELIRRHREEDRPPPLPTGSPELDRLLRGGLPRGHLLELVGGRSSGRFSLALAVLAAATQAGEAAAMVDLGDGLDPAGAAAAGVELERLLWLRPRQLRQALAGAEMLVTTGFPLVAIDLGVPPVPRGGLDARGAQAAWLRLSRAARSHGACLLVSAPYRASGAGASEVLAVHGRAESRRLHHRRAASSTAPAAAGSPRLLLGMDTVIALEKARGWPPGATETLYLSTVEALLHHTRPAGGRSREERGGRTEREMPVRAVAAS